jgi:hypothetical protein
MRRRVAHLAALNRQWAVALRSSGYAELALPGNQVPSGEQIEQMTEAELLALSNSLEVSLEQMRSRFVAANRRYQIARMAGLPRIHSEPSQAAIRQQRQLTAAAIVEPAVGPTWRGNVPNPVQNKLLPTAWQPVPDYSHAARVTALGSWYPAWRWRQMSGGIYSRSYFFTRGR